MTTQEYDSVSEAFGEILGDATLKDDFEQQMCKRRVVKTLAVLRAASGATQKDMARELGCTQSRVSKIENGFDADLRFSELEAYAKVIDCDITLMFSNRGESLADQIKHHAFAIRNAFLQLASIAHTDPAIAQGVAELNVQAFQNINRFLQETAEKLPLRPDNGRPYIQIVGCELIGGGKTTDDEPSTIPAESEDNAVTTPTQTAR